METINPVVNFLFGFTLNEIPKKTFILDSHQPFICGALPALQRQFRLYIPFLGKARRQPQYPHSCVYERFIYSQDQSTYFLQQNRKTHRGNI